MDDDSGESVVEDEVAGVGRDESDWNQQLNQWHIKLSNLLTPRSLHRQMNEHQAEALHLPNHH